MTPVGSIPSMQAEYDRLSAENDALQSDLLGRIKYATNLTRTITSDLQKERTLPNDGETTLERSAKLIDLYKKQIIECQRDLIKIEEAIKVDENELKKVNGNDLWKLRFAALLLQKHVQAHSHDIKDSHGRSRRSRSDSSECWLNTGFMVLAQSHHVGTKGNFPFCSKLPLDKDRPALHVATDGTPGGVNPMREDLFYMKVMGYTWTSTNGYQKVNCKGHPSENGYIFLEKDRIIPGSKQYQRGWVKS